MEHSVCNLLSMQMLNLCFAFVGVLFCWLLFAVWPPVQMVSLERHHLLPFHCCSKIHCNFRHHIDWPTLNICKRCLPADDLWWMGFAVADFFQYLHLWCTHLVNKLDHYKRNPNCMVMNSNMLRQLLEIVSQKTKKEQIIERPDYFSLMPNFNPTFPWNVIK